MTVVFRNEGVIDLHGVTTFGLCAKESKNPIGYFGTGLKYAIAVLLREGCEVVLNAGEKQLIFGTRLLRVRNDDFQEVTLNDVGLNFTTDLGRNWELWMAYRELAANAFDEGGTVNKIEGRAIPQKGVTSIMVVDPSGRFDKVYDERDTIFIEGKPRWELEGVDVYDTMGGGTYVYRKGIRAMVLPKPALYTYDIQEGLRLTEDRTVSSTSDVYIALAKALSKCEDATLIRQILLADQRFWESTIDYHWWSVKPGEVFTMVMERLMATHTSFNRSARELYRRDHPKDAEPSCYQYEAIPIEKRRRLWAALTFWAKLGFNIPRTSVMVAERLEGSKNYKVIGGRIYLDYAVLSNDMRWLTGIIFKAYCDTKPKIGDTAREDLFLDTLVDFGEQLLGVAQKKVV